MKPVFYTVTDICDVFCVSVDVRYAYLTLKFSSVHIITLAQTNTHEREFRKGRFGPLTFRT